SWRWSVSPPVVRSGTPTRFCERCFAGSPPAPSLHGGHRRSSGDGRDVARRPVELKEFIRGSGILGRLVVAPAAGEAREAQCQPRVVGGPTPCGGVVWGRGPLCAPPF